MRVTDHRDFPRLQLPPTRPQKEEAVMQRKEATWMEIFMRFRRLNHNEKGQDKKRQYDQK